VCKVAPPRNALVGFYTPASMRRQHYVPEEMCNAPLKFPPENQPRFIPLWNG
jgi:hypothetical protein